MSLTISGNLFMATGVLHCAVGLLIEEIRTPLLRIVREGTVEVTSSLSDQYERECAFWFEFGGIMMMAQGYLLRQYCLETQKLPPQWFGGFLTFVSGLGVMVMPKSGFWLALGQGLYILWSGRSDNRTKKGSKAA